FDLGQLVQTLKLDAALRGRVKANLLVGGTADDPRLDAHVVGSDFQYEQMPKTQLDLAAKTDRAGKLLVRFDASAVEHESYVELRTPWTLARLIQKPPTKE